jgi:hypothetical protein
LKTDDEFEFDEVIYVNKHSQYDGYATSTVPAVLPPSDSVNVFSRDDLMYQQDSNGDVKLLTNNTGNIYDESESGVAIAATTTRDIPQDTRHFVGDGTNTTVTTDGSTATVVVTRINHGLSNGTLITVVTVGGVGGITGVNLSVTNAAIANVTADTFEYTALAASTFVDTGPLAYVRAKVDRYYVVGSGELEIYLSGQLLEEGNGYSEVGVLNSTSKQITWNRNIVTTDVVTYRIDGNGGQFFLDTAAAPSDIFLTNNTGSAINPGDVVRLSATVAGELELANASALATTEGTVGVAVETIANGAAGRIRTGGLVTINAAAALTIGKFAYLHTVNGQASSTKPGSGNYEFILGSAFSTTQIVLHPQYVGQIP